MGLSTKENRFQVMVMPHLDAAFNLARWLTGSQQDAEDIVQEAYLRAFKFFDSFHGDDGRAWLLGIVRNTFYTWYQQNKAVAQNVEFEEALHSTQLQDAALNQSDNNNPETILMHNDSQRLLQQALATLPVEFREVIVMHELGELSYKQIAQIVGIPIGTVMSRLSRGRKALAKMISATHREA